jgi:hypothetical protein
MRPYALMEHSPESLETDGISRGRLHRAEENGYGRKSFDILTSFRDALGKTAGHVPENYERGELVIDTAMDLETNATTGLKRENSLRVRRGPLPDDAVVKMAQTFRSGTGDIDAIDYIEMFLENDRETDPAELNDIYVLKNFRPVVTKKNWRKDCGVAGYDNTLGLPPFFPTHLRCEDYIDRLWVQQIVDIALKAISPAVNDPSTAITGVDQLGRILIRFVSRGAPTALLCDPPHVVRVIVPWIATAQVLDTAFEQIRHYARSDIAVSLRLLRALDDIASSCGDARIIESLIVRGRRILAGCTEHLGPDQVEMLRNRLSALEVRVNSVRTVGATEASPETDNARSDQHRVCENLPKKEAVRADGSRTDLKAPVINSLVGHAGIIVLKILA